MNNTRLKKLIHLIAKYPADYPSTLEDDFTKAQSSLPTVEHRRFPVGDKIYHGLLFEKRSDYFAFQFATSVPGESTSTLPNAGVTTDKTELGQMAAPLGHDFSDGDIVGIITGNNIFVCASQLREFAIGTYAKTLFKSLGMEQAEKIAILHAANIETLGIIRKEGISSIRTRTLLNQATVERYKDADKGLLSRILNAFLEEDSSLLSRAAETNPNFSLSFSRSRFSRGANMDWAIEIAKEFIEEDVPYLIETGSGTILTNQNLYVSKKVPLTKNGKSVFVDEALDALEEFKNALLSR